MSPLARAIVGGRPDPTSQYTTVSLRSDSGSCTGSLINATWVLTAAHCLVNSNGRGPSYVDARSVDAVSGATIWLSTGVSYAVHPGYDRTTNANDIGLIRLRDAIAAPYVALASSGEVDAVESLGGAAIASGFGRTSTGGITSPIPLGVTLQLVPRDLCQISWSYRVPYLSSFVCVAPSLSAAVCNGDSGGPLFVQVGGVRKLAGVTSFGSTTCGANFSVFSRVTSFVEWMTSVIGASPTTPTTAVSTTTSSTTTVVGVPATSTTTSSTTSTTAPGSQVVNFPSLPPAVAVSVPPMYPVVADTGAPVLPKFSSSRAFQLVVVPSGRQCSIDVDAAVTLRGRRLDVFVGKSQKSPTFSRILDEFGDITFRLKQDCKTATRSGIYVRLDNSTIRFRAVL